MVTVDAQLIMGTMQCAATFITVVYFMSLICRKGVAEPVPRYAEWNEVNRIIHIESTVPLETWYSKSISEFASAPGSSGAKLMASSSAIVGTIQIIAAGSTLTHVNLDSYIIARAILWICGGVFCVFIGSFEAAILRKDKYKGEIIEASVKPVVNQCCLTFCCYGPEGTMRVDQVPDLPADSSAGVGEYWKARYDIFHISSAMLFMTLNFVAALLAYLRPPVIAGDNSSAATIVFILALIGYSCFFLFSGFQACSGNYNRFIPVAFECNCCPQFSSQFCVGCVNVGAGFTHKPDNTTRMCIGRYLIGVELFAFVFIILSNAISNVLQMDLLYAQSSG